MADGKKIVDLTLSRFYEAMERTNAEKIAHETCWNLLSTARRPTRVNSGDNRVTCSGAIALLI
jgi:hypothetical protein